MTNEQLAVLLDNIKKQIIEARNKIEDNLPEDMIIKFAPGALFFRKDVPILYPLDSIIDQLIGDIYLLTTSHE